MEQRYDIGREDAERLVGVLEGENDIVRIVDPLTREILYWPAVENGTLDCPCEQCNSVWGRDERCPNCSSLEAVRLRQRTFKMELSGNRAFWVQSRPLNMDGVECVLETVNDVTEGLLVEGSNREGVSGLVNSLGGLIMTDALTSLYNRRFIDEFCKRLPDLEGAGVQVNVAMMDLDNMKQTNDTYGHPAGDAVLKDVAGFLKLNFSRHDTRRESYAIRYGGDEFVVIDVGSPHEEFARDVRMRYASMRRVCYFDDCELPFSMSYGFAGSDEFGWSWDALLAAADRRMYICKRASR